MSAKAKKPVVPRLRFAEFRDTGEWEFKEIREVGDIVTGKTPNTKDDNLWNGNILFITPTDIDGQAKYQISTQRKVVETKETKLLPPGSILYTCIASIGKIAITKGKSISNQQINSIITNSTNNNEFIYYCLLHLTPWIKSIPASSTLPIINKQEFSKIKIRITPKKEEQQKIAACLTALDDLISAAMERLDALKQHKQGLMQQLFPTEGKTVPRLRFAEFRDAGEWERKKLENIGEPLMCKRIFKSQIITNSENAVPFYKIGTFGRVADSYISYELYNEYKGKYSFPNKGEILISASGTIGRLVVYNGEAAYFQDSNIVWLGHNEELVKNNFLFYCYSILNWQTSDGGIIKRLYNSDLNNIKVCFPKAKKEQQKIAACLTALDDLISAQTQKIAKLKTHKHGLMQQLFPAVDETH